jgi:hypothetical protein
LEAVGREQHRLVLSQAAEGRVEAEADQAQDEDPLPAQVVGDPTAEQQRAAERQGVAGQQPLAVGAVYVG